MPAGTTGTALTSLAVHNLLSLALFLALPAVWRDAARLSPSWLRWEAVQERLERASSRALPSASSRWPAVVLLVAMVSWASAVAVPLALLPEAPEAALPAAHAAVVAYPSLAAALLALLWLRVLGVLRQAAAALADAFQDVSTATGLADSVDCALLVTARRW